MSREVVVVDGLRTPYARAGTLLKDVPAQELGRIVIGELLARTGFDPAGLDQVILGNIAEPPDAVNVSRVAALRAGVPARVPAYTVNRLCGSGLESIVDAAYRIAAGDAEAIVAGGVESMSNIPLFFPKEGREAFAEVLTARDLPGRVGAAAKLRPRHFKPEIGLQMGLTDPVCGLNMGETAELLAKEHGISREEQDAFALRSHQRATAARARLAEEIVPVPIPPDYRGHGDAGQRRAREPDDGGAGQAPALLRPEVRDGHGRQLFPDHRRRRRDARDERAGGEGAGLPAAREDPRVRLRGARARADGPRAGGRRARSRSSAPASPGRTSASSSSTRRSRRRSWPTRASFRRRPGTRGTARAGRSARSTGRRPTSTAARSRSVIPSAPRPTAS